MLAKPGSITPHTQFEAQVYVLSKEEGGRHTPFFTGYRPQFYFRTTDVTGTVNLLGGAEMCMPGDNIKMEVELISPDRHGRELALRHPRRRPHGGFRRGDQDHQVIVGLPKRPEQSPGRTIQGCSSIGRALVSKTSGWEFESPRPCHLNTLFDTIRRGPDLQKVNQDRT